MPVTPVFRSHLVQLAILTITLFATLTPCSATAVLAADQGRERRHSLIHRPAVESPALPAPREGTLVQPLSDQPPRLTSQTGPPKTSTPPTTVPMTHHRKLAKHPVVASAAAPATSSRAPHSALISGTATGQVAQATTDTTKATTPPAMAPVTKSTTNPLSGVITSTGAPTAAQKSSTPAPLAHAGTASPVASPGSGSAPSFGGSRSALNLLQNSAIASLLQAPTPVVITPPSLPPSPTPPSTPPPSPSTGNVTLSWAANMEPDLAGYKVYVGTASGRYDFPGSPFAAGTVSSYTVLNLPKPQTYFFALSAYDSAGNESTLSAEVSKSLY